MHSSAWDCCKHAFYYQTYPNSTTSQWIANHGGSGVCQSTTITSTCWSKWSKDERNNGIVIYYTNWLIFLQLQCQICLLILWFTATSEVKMCHVFIFSHFRSARTSIERVFGILKSSYCSVGTRRFCHRKNLAPLICNIGAALHNRRKLFFLDFRNQLLSEVRWVKLTSKLWLLVFHWTLMRFDVFTSILCILIGQKEEQTLNCVGI